MPRPRKTLIDPSITDTYHCTSRCVLGAFLCGFDKVSQTDYEHRRTWVEDRIKQLSTCFSIGVCAYAVMHNHYHIVLKVDHVNADKLTDIQVLNQWLSIFPNSHGAEIAKLTIEGKASKEQKIIATQIVVKWRKRLTSISWFMRALNEFIARKANIESGQTGHFWESRFKSQALLDDAAVLGCMAYVDLNPIRANIADSLEQSEHTSIKLRVESLKKSKHLRAGRKPNRAQPSCLVPFSHRSNCLAISFSLVEYLNLLDFSGRIVRPDKKGKIGRTEPHILAKLGIEQAQWKLYCNSFEAQFSYFVGSSTNSVNIP